MTGRNLVLGLVAACGVTAAVGVWWLSEGGGQTGFEPNSLSLGELTWNETVAFEARFVNRGELPIAIKDLTSSCGCTVIRRLDPDTRIEPGEALVIPATFKAGRKQGEKSATITLVGDGDSTFKFDVTAIIRTTYTLDPLSLNFGTLDLDESGENTAAITYQSSTESLVNVELADPDSPWIETTIERLAGNAAKIHVGLIADSVPAGRSTTRLLVRTTSSAVPTTIVPVLVKAVSAKRLEAYPPRVYLSSIPQRIHFVDAEGNRPQLRSARIDEPFSHRIDAVLLEGGLIELRRQPSDRASGTASVTVEDTAGRTGRCVVTLQGDPP